MPKLIGMDEAGLGPNLGPFVVAVTVWDVPTTPRTFDLWDAFSEVFTNEPGTNDARLHIADSKQVFQPHKGLHGLERPVLAALRLLGHTPRTFRELHELLVTANALKAESDEAESWYRDHDFELPTADHDFSMVEHWQRCCHDRDVRLVAVKVALVEAPRFNRLLREYDNKSLVVSRIAFELLRSVWDPDETETFIVGDKHGGRNRYDQLLAEVLDGEMIFRLEESAERSEYRVGKTVLRFQPRAEVHAPVALASMTAKYVRELAMTQFNRFWARHIDDLRPTQGYPLDARRFRDEIAEVQQRLGILDDHLWRNR
ncbi:hypothetical protein [Schlesneria paludicola]|uniref:hypothetical protein n=1 Tax=Schlesneria paludicola TaxID=360056 RepID=UPI00029B0C3B|nr:hypothetical protein [Schlesneria paludicola]